MDWPSAFAIVVGQSVFCSPTYFAGDRIRRDYVIALSISDPVFRRDENTIPGHDDSSIIGVDENSVPGYWCWVWVLSADVRCHKGEQQKAAQNKEKSSGCVLHCVPYLHLVTNCDGLTGSH